MLENCFYTIVKFCLAVSMIVEYPWLFQTLVNMCDFLLLFGGKETILCAFCQFFFIFSFQFIARCTCPCTLSFLPLASQPKTLSTNSTCTLGSAWEIWNGYSNCSAWLDWDIDEAADCPYPGSINGHFWGFLFIYKTPICVTVHVVVFVFMHLFVHVGSVCSVYSLCLCVGGEPAGRVPSKWKAQLG